MHDTYINITSYYRQIKLMTWDALEMTALFPKHLYTIEISEDYLLYFDQTLSTAGIMNLFI